MIFISLMGNRATIKGFLIKSSEKAIRMAEDMLLKGNSYTKEYAGGTIAVIASDGVKLWSKSIPEKRL